MIPLHVKRSIEMWMRQEFPHEDIRFIRKRAGGFVVRCQNKRIDKRRVKRVVNQFYRCACGLRVKWATMKSSVQLAPPGTLDLAQEQAIDKRRKAKQGKRRSR